MRGAEDPLSLLGVAAQHFGVSWSAVAVRLKTLRLISQDQLDIQLRIAGRLAAEGLARRREKARASKGGPAHHVLKLRNLGPRYVESVLDAFHDNRISATDASYFLESKQGVIAKMERELVKGVTAE
jgi:Zn-dependent peptidase ImmA (M78 family)